MDIWKESVVYRPLTYPQIFFSNCRDPLGSFADVIPQPTIGPSMTINGQTAQWTGSCTSGLGRVGVASRVSFEAHTKERAVSLLNICNDGTTVIYYSWKVL